MPKHRVLSFKYALEGIFTALKEEPNLKFHFLAAYLTLILGMIFQISITEWLIISLAIGLVIGMELTNTAIEELVNSFTTNFHPSAKKIKDISAGAVFVASFTAFIIGLLIFVPYLTQLFNLRLF